MQLSKGENWKGETSFYNCRLVAANERLTQAGSSLHCIEIELPLSVPLTERQREAVQLYVFVVGAVRTMVPLGATLIKSWEDGAFVTAFLNARLIYEYLGSLTFAVDLAKRVETDGSDSIQEKISRLTGGARTEVSLPWGGVTDIRSFNVMDFVRAADHRFGISKDYEFLCEACHPSHLHQGYIYMLGPDGDNWSNKIFAQHGHSILERLTQCFENCCSAAPDVLSEMVSILSPILATIQENNN